MTGQFRILHGPSVLVLFLVSFCVAATEGAEKKKPKTERYSLELPKPSFALEPVEGYTAMQTIGGVRVEVTAVPFEVRPMFFVSLEQRKKFMVLTGVAGNIPVWAGIIPFLQVEPGNIQLKLRITNHLGKVLRMQGVALQFQKDGETLNTDYEQLGLERVIILPEKSWEGTLDGPPLSAFGLTQFDATNAGLGLVKPTGDSKEGVLVVGLYDVITELDAASNPKTRSNFEWIFSYSASTVVEQALAVRMEGWAKEADFKTMPGVRTAEELGSMFPAEFLAEIPKN